MKRKILTAIATLILTLGGLWTLTGCNGDFRKTYEDGYYKYQLWGDKYVNISDLTESGKQQKILVIPNEIKGIAVTAVQNSRALYASGANFESENLEKVFIPYQIYIHRDIDYLDSTKIICIGDNGNFSSGYVSKGYADIHEGSLWSDTKIANVSFLYNYETDINYGYYWIDDIDYGKIIEYIPENPKREGFEFGGWYKESECVSKWAFETDLIEQEKLLYAKWV